MLGRLRATHDDPQVPCRPVLQSCAHPFGVARPGRLADVRVRMLELRLIAVALTGCWALTAALVLAVYRPGGPVDIAVGLVALGPIAIAVAGLVWPPATHGPRAFAGMVWLGLGSLLVLVPSMIDVNDQLASGGSQTLLPSVEAAYPWALALLGTSLFAGFGIARRVLGETAMRRRRLVRGSVVAILLAVSAGSLFTAAAMANELALRDKPTASSRFGPTDTGREPPSCDAPLTMAASARVEVSLDGNLDGRSMGSISLAGDRSGTDFRWLAYAATTSELGLHGEARIGEDAWVREPFGGWRRATTDEVAGGTVDSQAILVALSTSQRAAAELHGVDVVEGARARHCRIAVDGPTFRHAFPEVQWLVGSIEMTHWRGQLDYWIFLDGELGQIIGSVNGDGAGIKDGALQATIRVDLNATERGVPVHLNAPTP
jgi:hypothetical protein